MEGQPLQAKLSRRAQTSAKELRHIKTAFSLGLTLCAFMTLPALGAEQFQCPSFSRPNNPAKLEQIRGLLPNTDAMTNIEQLNAMIATLRRDGTSKSLITDHLIGAYCPMVLREAPLKETEKATLVRRFTGQVTRSVYSLESGLDIVINVPLTPDIVDAVNSVAKEQGLSGPALIAMTIENALQPQGAAQHR
jgi:hypothetical protein